MKRRIFGNKKVIKARKARPIRTVKGVLRGNSRGFAFLDCGEADDIFIPAKYLKDAIHGDEVEADVYPDHGEVKRIVRANTFEIIGVYVTEMRRGKVIADGNCVRDVFVTGGKAQSGDRVVVKLSHKDRSRGEIVEVLGKAGTLSADIAAVVRSLSIEQFSPSTIRETDHVASQPVIKDGREDFTDQPCFTIDGDDSKDFDDAVYCERKGSGYRLWVHIADVAHYVKAGSLADKAALKRGNSFYYGNNVIPMLPESLSNGACSLNENEDRYTLSAIIDVSADGKIIGGDVKEGVIRSHKRMTYALAAASLDGTSHEYDAFLPTLEILLDLRNALKTRRDDEGNIDFDLPEPKFTFDGETVVGAKCADRLITHSIIEECMIAANRVVAAKFLALKTPFVYREHKPPEPSSIQKLNDYLSAIGEGELLGSSSKDVANLLSSLQGSKRRAVSAVALRCMTKAEYSVKCGGHFGLAIKEYCHFTSPIRRYSDLTAHRVIKAYLHGEDCSAYKDFVSRAAEVASSREKLCEKAERKIDDLYMASYMSRFIGEVFDGFISGVTEKGIFVALDNTAEGLVRAESLGETEFDETSMSMTVLGRGVFKLGDSVKVKLISASSGLINFELA